MGTDEAKQRLKECPSLMQYFKEFSSVSYDWLLVYFCTLACIHFSQFDLFNVHNKETWPNANEFLLKPFLSRNCRLQNYPSEAALYVLKCNLIGIVLCMIKHFIVLDCISVRAFSNADLTVKQLSDKIKL
jgi:hypothetical protein